MVLNYDRNPNRTTDEKIESLIENIQLALNEINDKLVDQEKTLDDIRKRLDSIGA